MPCTSLRFPDTNLVLNLQRKLQCALRVLARGSLTFHDFKKHAGKSSSHGMDLDSRLVLAFQAPPSWPIDPGDTRTQVTDVPTSSPPPPVENQDLIMEVDPGDLNVGSKPGPPPEKILNWNIRGLVSNGRARVIAGWNPVTIQVADVILCRDWIGLIAKERHGSQTFASFGVYLHPNRLARQAALCSLGSSICTLNLPTAVLGDFNATTTLALLRIPDDTSRGATIGIILIRSCANWTGPWLMLIGCFMLGLRIVFKSYLVVPRTIVLWSSVLLTLLVGNPKEVASGRKSRQSLSALSLGDLTIEAQDQINEECTKFFKALLCDDAATGSMFDHISPSPTVSREENLQLLAPISDLEIKRAVFSSKADSAPGPDGFPAFFFQRYWHIVGGDVTKAIKGFFETGRLVKKINRSILVLIPKHQGICSPQDLRPIALCNSLYKFITKIICSRLRPILARIIADSQGAFTKGRKLQDQVAMAHEVISSMSTHYAPSVCCQLDLSKAYDRVNWAFLRNSLLSLGFHDTWVARIMTCVSTASIAISVNGVVGQYFNSSRGLRQGDPMSPLLFIAIMECLHRRILRSVNTNKLCGPTLPRIGKASVELFFADDIIFFLPLKSEFLQELKSIMADFEIKAGMRVNDAKSRMVTFNAQEDLSNLVAASTGLKTATHYDFDANRLAMEVFPSSYPVVDRLLFQEGMAEPVLALNLSNCDMESLGLEEFNSFRRPAHLPTA
ncbi:retrotransposable element ORF2 protein [Nymphaea thermarum]|nr:retrotransposable element ORF2 protein [Nymphaea thermarum]